MLLNAPKKYCGEQSTFTYRVGFCAIQIYQRRKKEENPLRLFSFMPFAAATAACAIAALAPLAARADVTVFSDFGPNHTYALGGYNYLYSDGPLASRFTATDSSAAFNTFDIGMRTSNPTSLTVSLYADNNTGVPFGPALLTIARNDIAPYDTNVPGNFSFYTFSSASSVAITSGISYWVTTAPDTKTRPPTPILGGV